MKLIKRSEWFEFDYPLGEPDTYWNKNDKYSIERFTNSDGEIIWFGINTNWKKKPGGNWQVLTRNENATPLEKYLPDIVYGEDLMIFVDCEPPIYEKIYLKNNL